MKPKPSTSDKPGPLLSNRTEPLLQVFAAVLAFLFLLSGISYLILGRWAATHLDFWQLDQTFLKYSWLHSSLLKYNGHSLFFPVQIWLIDLRFFHANQDFLFAVGVTLQLISVGLLFQPIWRDTTISRTQKSAAILVLVIGNFWTARATMTASGAFNCCYSLTMIGAAVSVICLPALSSKRDRWWPVTLLALCGSFVASFSFGTGLAVWPAVLLLGYCTRARISRLAAIGAAGIVTSIIYVLLPARDPSAHLIATVNFHSPVTYATLLYYCCRILGSPLGHAVAGWSTARNPIAGNFAPLSLSAGVIGSVSFCLATLHALFRRDLRGGVQATGLALAAFTFVGIALITIARAKHISDIPDELDAPRYIFWSSLFWTGVLLLALANSRQWLRWATIGIVLALPLFLLPSHYKEGARARFVRYLSENAATSLINGVRDSRYATILFPSPDQVYRVAQQLRESRLDMFAEGWQDWPGESDTELFNRKATAARMKANCRIEAYVPCDGGAKAARITGWVLGPRNVAPSKLVIVNEHGIICGVVRTFSTSDFVNGVFYANRFPRSTLLGYIRDYIPGKKYVMRTADEAALSNESIPIPAPAGNIETH